MSLNERTKLIILNTLNELEKFAGRSLLSKTLHGTKKYSSKISPYYGVFNNLKISEILDFIDILINENYLEIFEGPRFKHPLLRITEKGEKYISENIHNFNEIKKEIKTTSNHLDNNGNQDNEEGVIDLNIKYESIDDVPSATIKKTYDLFKQNKTVDEIASLKNCKKSTIYDHLEFLVSNHLLNFSEVVEVEKRKIILKAIKTESYAGIKELKKNLPNDIAYGEIKLGLAHVFNDPSLTEDQKNRIYLRTINRIVMLGLIGTKEDIPKLIEYTYSNDAFDRKHAVISLGKLNQIKPEIYDSIPRLLELVNDKNSEVKYHSVISLGKIGNKKIVPFLEKIIDSNHNDFLKEIAKKTIRKISNGNIEENEFNQYLNRSINKYDVTNKKNDLNYIKYKDQYRQNEWTEEKNELLLKDYFEGESINNLAIKFNKKMGQIRYQIKKLSKDKFCTQCLSRIVGDEIYCLNCGNRLFKRRPQKYLKDAIQKHDNNQKNQYQGRFYESPINIFQILKKEYPNHLIFIQNGYFFEVYRKDAKDCSNIFGWNIYDNYNILQTGVPINAYKFKNILKKLNRKFIIVKQDNEDYKNNDIIRSIYEIYP
jgi:hypothetical protein